MKIKVLWILNQPLAIVANEFNRQIILGGWLDGIAKSLMTYDIEQYILFKNNINQTKIVEKNGITFIGISNKNFHSNSLKCISEINPKIIHVFGTENIEINKIALECNVEKVVVSLQGIMKENSHKYYSNINRHYRLPLFRNIFLLVLVYLNRRNYITISKSEVKLIGKLKYIIGRTEFDRNFVNKYSSARYFKCNENLRDIFYHSSHWDISKIKRYSIYLSQGNIPIKGLHIVLKALSIVVLRYPNVFLTISGENILKSRSIATALGISYSSFIKWIIQKNNLSKNLQFVGFKTDKEVKDILLNTHVAITSSSIENSPNSLGEAMILGVPTISSKVGGIPSMISSMKNPNFFTYPDANELAEKIIGIFSNDELAKELSNDSIKVANDIFDSSKNAEILLDVYKNIDRNF